MTYQFRLLCIAFQMEKNVQPKYGQQRVIQFRVFSDAEKVALISPYSVDDIIEYIAPWSKNVLLLSSPEPKAHC